MKSNTSIILLLLSVLLFYTFTNGQYRNATELAAVAENYRNVLRNASDIVVLRDNLLVTYDSFPRAEIERINKVLPDNVDTVRLALDLDGMAANHNISIKSVQTSADNSANAITLPGRTGAYERASVSFSFVSNYDNFMNLLADLEKNLRIMDITSITFLATESGLYEYQVTVDTYWLK